jgi:predicted small integral membrane protein
MIVMRLSKAFLVLLIGIFCVLVAANNIFDYGSNFNFVRHVMLMDTTFPDNKLMWRAIASPTIHHLAYWLIIAGEMSAGLLCLAGSIALFRAAPRRRSEFIHAKRAAVAGLTLGIFVWFFGFMTVAAEWFLMWQSQQWNAVQAAFRFIMCLAVVLIYLSQDDADLDAPSPALGEDYRDARRIRSDGARSTALGRTRAEPILED